VYAIVAWPEDILSGKPRLSYTNDSTLVILDGQKIIDTTYSAGGVTGNQGIQYQTIPCSHEGVIESEY